MSHVINMIVIISPNRFSSIFFRTLTKKPCLHLQQHHRELSSLQCFIPLHYFMLILLLMIQEASFMSVFAELNLCS